MESQRSLRAGNLEKGRELRPKPKHLEDKQSGTTTTIRAERFPLKAKAVGSPSDPKGQR
jgi:hypothetical protein